MIASVVITALGLGFLSQSHWVARAFWMSSLVTALLAVFYAGNLVWAVGRLFTGRQIRAWIRRNDVTILDVLRSERERPVSLRSIISPSVLSTIVISAPGVLLAASLLFLLLGFGVYLGFVWTRSLDDSAGRNDSRDVFIVYIVVLGIFYVLYSVVDMGQNYKSGLTTGSTLDDCVRKIEDNWPRYIQDQEEALHIKKAKSDLTRLKFASLRQRIALQDGQERRERMDLATKTQEHLKLWHMAATTFAGDDLKKCDTSEDYEIKELHRREIEMTMKLLDVLGLERMPGARDPKLLELFIHRLAQI
jgi:hypothetical protein